LPLVPVVNHTVEEEKDEHKKYIIVKEKPKEEEEHKKVGVVQGHCTVWPYV
jgi:hypothetical protein